MRNTLASTLGNSIKKDRFYSSVRNYSSSLEHSLDRDNISVDVYINLIDTVGDNLRLLHRYLELRKKSSGSTNYICSTCMCRWLKLPKQTYCMKIR